MNTKSLSPTSARARGSLCRFWREEDGSHTLEAVIWFPLFAIVLAFIMNLSIVFFTESQILRVIQDGNRAFSLGRLDNAEAVETYVLERLSYLDATFNIATTISGGFVTTRLDVPASHLMPLNFMVSAFEGVTIAVDATHIIEF